LKRLRPFPVRGNLLVALAGNPNGGKSTLLRQHTGNWPGKTVALAWGEFFYQGYRVNLVDLPGTYSLWACLPEEEVARDFIFSQKAQALVIVADATCLERSLNLVFQIGEVTSRSILCLNCMDEARRRGLIIDEEGLSRELEIPVVPTVALTGEGLEALKKAIVEVATGRLKPCPQKVYYGEEVEEILSRASSRWEGLKALMGGCPWRG